MTDRPQLQQTLEDCAADMTERFPEMKDGKFVRAINYLRVLWTSPRDLEAPRE